MAICKQNLYHLSTI